MEQTMELLKAMQEMLQEMKGDTRNSWRKMDANEVEMKARVEAHEERMQSNMKA
jgi:hypothetical protein